MVNEQEETATSSNVSSADGSKHDEKYSRITFNKLGTLCMRTN